MNILHRLARMCLFITIWFHRKLERHFWVNWTDPTLGDPNRGAARYIVDKTITWVEEKQECLICGAVVYITTDPMLPRRFLFDGGEGEIKPVLPCPEELIRQTLES